MKNTTTQVTSRGRVVTGDLTRSIVFNSTTITRAVIEVDHINYGLDKRTKKLKTVARTNFTVSDIEKFLFLLDGEDIFTSKHKGRISQYQFRVDCPIKGRFYKKEFIMFFDTNYDKPHEIYTVTIYPGW